jgi:hypothetical protein
MEFECNTPVHWLRDARLQVEGQIVRVVLLAQVGTFPAGYVGMMDQPRANDAHDAVRIIMYTFSLIDDYYHDKVTDYPDQPTVSITVRAVDVWPIHDEETDPQTPTLDRLNDAALTLASMLITLDEYKIMRLAILSQ